MIYIDKNTGKAVNIHAPYKDRSRLEDQSARDELGIIGIDEDAPPVDFSYDTHTVRQDWGAVQRPYILYERKPEAEIQRNRDLYDMQNAKRHLADTDYLFSLDRNATLVATEPERAAALVASREAAREVLRVFKAKYPVLP